MTEQTAVIPLDCHECGFIIPAGASAWSPPAFTSYAFCCPGCAFDWDTGRRPIWEDEMPELPLTESEAMALMR